MTYDEALDRIHQRLRFGNKLTLTRIRELLRHLGDPQKDMRIIHVAGTNGKGSVSKLIYSALKSQGYKVGVYTSPYLIDFRERIEFDGSWIARDELASITKTVLNAAAYMESTGADSPTEFEVVMAIAFVYFKKKNCDFVVLEVGLGGRGDATNVIENPLVSVITSIAYDHMEYLGDTLADIAGEKAGIIKPGRPVVYNVGDISASAVIELRASELGCDFYPVRALANSADIEELSLDGVRFSINMFDQAYDHVFIPLPGVHQVQNGVTALCALNVLKNQVGIRLDKESILEGFASVVHIGRLEKLQDNPLVVIDGAHNEEGMDAFVRSVKPLTEGKKCLLILGILKDKQYGKMLKSAMSLGFDLALSEPENARKASARQLAEVVVLMGGHPVVLGDASTAVNYALSKKSDYDCIFFAGSLYFVGAVRLLWPRVELPKEAYSVRPV